MKFKNNNPGNIRYNPKLPYQIGRSASGFGVYSSTVTGLAGMLDLLNRYHKRGLNTISKIVSTWAPPIENQTQTYISNVSRWTGIPAGRVLAPGELSKIVPAMVRQEHGKKVDPFLMAIAKNYRFVPLAFLAAGAVLLHHHRQQDR